MEDLSRDCLPDSTPELLSSAQAPDRRPCLRGRGTRDPASRGRPSLLLDPDGCEQQALRAVGVIYRSPLQLASMNLKGGLHANQRRGMSSFPTLANWRLASGKTTRNVQNLILPIPDSIWLSVFGPPGVLRL